MSNITKIFLTVLCSIVPILIEPAYADDIAKQAADELNQLYQRTTPCDNNQPAYYCSGIIIHGRMPEEDNLIPSWYLPNHRNVGSFSYLRADITPHIGESVFTNTGFILTPTDELKIRHQFSYTLYCEYPTDGATLGNLEDSCPISAEHRQSLCGNEIQSVNNFVDKYLNNQSMRDWPMFISHYYFSPEKDRFDLAMQLHKFIYQDNTDKTDCPVNKFCRVHNELVIGAWDINTVPDVKVPILAFYAIINDSSNPMFQKSGRTSTTNAELKQLFKDADAYSKSTHYTRRIPVVTLDMDKLRSGAKDIFAPAIR